ncbi:MAG: STAS domain-containing protein [Planctomycetes bacterium]|nr:STAS domain-containing protein [Planctomycetota bacterium]
MTEYPLKVAGKVGVIYLSGELRRESSDKIWSDISIAITQEVDAIVLSFLNVDALFSEGIRMLVAVRDKVEASGKIMHIADLPPDVRYTLKITNLLEFLNHEETTAEALLKYKELEKNLKDMDIKLPPPPPAAEAK